MGAFVVAIAGGSASGKTTFASALESALASDLPGRNIEVLSMDRFMRREDPDAPKIDFRFGGVTLFNANHPESVDNTRVLHEISESSSDVILLEGLMVLAVSALRERADQRLFIDLESDIRAARRVERDIRIKRGNSDPAFIAAYYIECARVGHQIHVEP